MGQEPLIKSISVTPPALGQLLHRQRTFPGAAAAASLGGDELPAQLGQTGFQQPQVVGGGLVLLRPGHLQGHRTEGSHREGSAALGPCATPGDRAPPPLHGVAHGRPSPRPEPRARPVRRCGTSASISAILARVPLMVASDPARPAAPQRRRSSRTARGRARAGRPLARDGGRDRARGARRRLRALP